MITGRRLAASRLLDAGRSLSDPPASPTTAALADPWNQPPAPNDIPAVGMPTPGGDHCGINPLRS
jgi:hypothetical protein